MPRGFCYCEYVDNMLQRRDELLVRVRVLGITMDEECWQFESVSNTITIEFEDVVWVLNNQKSDMHGFKKCWGTFWKFVENNVQKTNYLYDYVYYVQHWMKNVAIRNLRSCAEVLRNTYSKSTYSNQRILIFGPKFQLSTKLFVGLEQKNVGLAWNILG